MRVALLQVRHDGDANWSAPLGLRYLEAAASEVADVTVFDRIPDLASLCGYDVVGIYALSQDWDAARAYGEEVLRVGPSVVYGGPHVSACGHSGQFVPGEAEVEFRRMICGGSTGIDISRLDSIPIPKRGAGKPYLITSRGCPYRCTFCSSSRMSGSVRYHSAARVTMEIHRLLAENPGLKHVTIWDDLFAGNAGRLHVLARDARLPGVTYSCSMRAELCTEDRLASMQFMGVNRCGIGAESGSQRILSLLKPGATVEGNQAAIEALAKHKMRPGAGVIFGHWSETEADVEATYRWLAKNYAMGLLYQHTPNILTPLPGTPVWDHALAIGTVGGDSWRWSRLRYISRAAFPSADDWLCEREKNDSVYIGGVKWGTLRDMILHYEGRIAAGRFGVPGRPGSGTRMLARTAKKMAATIVRRK